MHEKDAKRKWRLGVVSYLNAKPLIAGLESDVHVDLVADVPARLPALLDDGSVDAAMVPAIDMIQPDRQWQIISDACIGCDGETLTVRVYSRVPPGQVRTLLVDGDSHTSVALARIVWRELYGRRIETAPLLGGEGADDSQAVLLIGDKVINNKLVGYDIETDLGSAWKSMTSLPFVFAVWAAPRGMDAAELGRRLSEARDAGVEAAEMIAADFGPGMGWPVTLAKRYLTMRMKYTLGPRQREGMFKFFELAQRHGIVSRAQDPVFA